MQMNHYFPRALPAPLKGLATLALDLRWSWNHGADALWHQVAPKLWEATANPWLILEAVSDQRLQTLAADAGFLEKLQQQLDAREAHFNEKSWFSENIDGAFDGYIAYFSMEFGICESLPIYSGGLGVLAGDYLKTACDLDVPLIGVGLLYQQGYFRQALSASGEQIEFYPYNDPTMLPVVPLRDDQGEWVHISIELPGRSLHLRSWRAQVGRRSLLLLVRELGIDMDTLLALGRADATDESFNMAYLALHGVGAVNAVSHLHGEVSRRIFSPLFPRWPKNGNDPVR